jgi:hypothetical protein
MLPRSLHILLIILNVLMLLGQVWPEGAPPFARAVNIITVAANVVVLTMILMRSRRFDA